MVVDDCRENFPKMALGIRRRFRQNWAILLASAVLVSVLVSHSIWLGSQVVLVSVAEFSPLDAPEEQIGFLPHHQGTSNATITVMVDLRAGWRDWGFSFFEAEQLQLYGRHNYKVEWFHFTNEPQRIQKLANDEESSSSSHACLLVSNPKGLDEIRQAHAPHCKTWIINDEYCTYQGDIRHYYKQSSTEFFIPLGPRYDFDRAFRDHHAGITTLEMRRNLPAMIPTSRRSYMFNAIFSKSTSPSRKDLKTMLLNSPKYAANSTNNINKGENSYFIKIPGKWRRQMHPVFHVNSSRYVDILSQSKFTISPTGHNPECFRLYESILMGSIPILAVADEEYQTHKCPNALEPLLESALHHAGVSTSLTQQVLQDIPNHLQVLQDHLPFVVLNNWTLLEVTLENVMKEGPEALDARQTKLQQWYFQFMRNQVWKLEDYLLMNK
jgi:hypothetical protein